MDTLAEQLGGLARPGDLVLLKGSRGLELERLLPMLESPGSRGGALGGGGRRC
jgi:UDP-N-acetylmuramyl pentapeptide synthase